MRLPCPDSRFLTSGADDSTVKLWDIGSKRLLHSFEGHTNDVESVAFSPNGLFLASGAGDGTVKLWDVKNKIEKNTLISGKNGNWLSYDNTQQIMRGDDGTFLRTKAKTSQWIPVPVANLVDKDNLSLNIDPISAITKPGETVELPITLKNNGSQPAFWLQVKPSQTEDSSLRLDPPDNVIKPNAKGEQPWKPSRIAKLNPGETATVYALISPNLKLPADFIQPGIHRLTVTVVSANSTEVSEQIEVDVQSPGLQWQQAKLEPDGQTLNISLNNNGSLPLTGARLGLYIRSLDAAQRNPGKDKLIESEIENPGLRSATSRLLAEQLISEIAAGDTVKLAFVLPENFDLKTSQLLLKGMTSDLPIFAWSLEAPEIERASRLMLWLLVPVLLLILTAIYYLRRYRHPLLLKLSNKPESLFKLHPEQLAEAKTRLRQTRRLKAVLSTADVSAKTFDKSIAFVKQKSLEEKANWVARRLGAEIGSLTLGERESSSSPGKEVQGEGFRIWELHLPEQFPLNLDHCLLCFPEIKTEAKDLLDSLRLMSQNSLYPILIIGPDSDFRRKLYETSKDRGNLFVTPSGQALTRLLIDPDPQKTLAEIFASQLSLTQISPYQVGGGVNSEFVFYGRREIITNIMNRDPANYLLVGGRQVGKSSLLKALNRRYSNISGVTCIYLALANEVLVPRLASALNLPSASSLEEIEAYLAKAPNRFLFLIDEADKFIAHERSHRYQILDAMRSWSEEGHCHFILAGFWDLYQHAVLDYQSPLKNFAEIIEVGALETEACRQLATEPIQTMGLDYASPALVEQLLETTGQRANLISISCHEILKRLPLDQSTIYAADVMRALSSEAVLNALKGWVKMTDDEKTCRLDRIIVYATIENQRFDLAGVVDDLKRLNIGVDINMIELSLSRLQLGFILGRDVQGNYSYRVPLFKELIKRDSPRIKLNAEIESWHV